MSKSEYFFDFEHTINQSKLAMIRRTFLTPFRAVEPSIRLATRSPLLRSQYRTNYTSVVQNLHKVSGMRWFGTEKEQQKAPGQDPELAKEPLKEDTQTKDAAKKELDAKNREIIELKDKYLRSVADFRNLQERTRREVQSAKDFAIQKFAKDLMESVDNLDRALAMVSEDRLTETEKSEEAKDLINLYDGLKMTEKILMQTLQKHGLERFDPSLEGEKFNPNEHEATFMTPVEGKDDGTVILTQVKGFRLNNRVIRAAKVGVVKN